MIIVTENWSRIKRESVILIIPLIDTLKNKISGAIYDTRVDSARDRK
jgi:hypothetical protein